jgi:hypothetical protein
MTVSYIEHNHMGNSKIKNIDMSLILLFAIAVNATFAVLSSTLNIAMTVSRGTVTINQLFIHGLVSLGLEL